MKPSAGTPSFDACFAGREAELAVLRGQLQEATAGTGRFVVVSGETGVGKTALVEQFRRELQGREEIVFASETFNADAAFAPYRPFVRLRQQLSPGTAVPAGAATGFRPEDGEQAVWEIENLYALQAEHQISQQKILSVLLSAAREQTLVVALHRMHLAPLSSWRFLHYLCEGISDHRILLLITVELDEGSARFREATASRDVLQRMNRERLVTQIRLQRFTHDEIKKFIYAVFAKTDFSSDFVPLLREITLGVPARLVEALQVLDAQGWIFQRQRIWFNREGLAREKLLKLLSSAEAQPKVLQQLQALANPERELVTYAAFIEGDFDHRLLAAVTGQRPIETLKRMKTLQERKIIAQTGAERWNFCTATLRAAARQLVAPDRQAEMHLHITRALEQDSELDAGMKVRLLAYHSSKAGQGSAALPYLRAAANLAISSFAFPEARAYLEQALAITGPDYRGLASGDAVQLLLQAGWLERVLGNWEQSLAHFSAAERISAGLSEAGIRGQILIQKGLTLFRLNHWQEARTSLDQALALEAALKPFDAAMALFGLGNIAFELAAYDEARQHLNRALEIGRSIHSKKLLANIYNILGALENIRGDGLKAIVWYSQSIPLFKAMRDASGQARIFHNIGMTHAEQGDWARANAFYGRSLRIADGLGLVPLKAITFLNRALALVHLQRFDEAREYNVKAYYLLERLNDQLGLAEYHKVQGVIEREDRHFRVAQEHLQQARYQFEMLENRLGAAETEYELAGLARAAGRLGEAQDWYERALASFCALEIQRKAKHIEEKMADLRKEQGAVPVPAGKAWAEKSEHNQEAVSG